jgi:hypothetical protein
MDKISLLSEDDKNEVIDFIDFLLSKNEKITLASISQSLNDIKNGDVDMIENDDDLNRHLEDMNL